MSKFLLASAIAGVCLTGTYAQAEMSKNILNSPALASARKCLDDFQTAGKKANFYTDRDGGRVLILNQTQQPLHPLLHGMTKCLDSALSHHEVVAHPKTKTRSRIWWTASDGGYVWCATNVLNNELGSIDVLGGSGPRRAWYGIPLNCSIGDDILGFHRPK